MLSLRRSAVMRLVLVLTPSLCGVVACGSASDGTPAHSDGGAPGSGNTAGAGTSAAGQGVGGSSFGGSNSAGAGTAGAASGGTGSPAAGSGAGGSAAGGSGPGATAGAAGSTASGGQSGSGGSTGGTPASCTGAASGTHFVDSAAGDDTRDGSTPATSWKTIARVNQATFQPGDSICFFAGGSWTGQLAPKGSGSAAAPIVIDQYGSGNKPKIAAGSGNLQALLLENLQYWEINHLELTNTQAAPGDYRGISIRGKDVGVLNHIYIRNSFVHDVTGEVLWIGGSTADNQAPWVTFQAGWDASKRTGGIVVEVESANGTKTWFNDVQIENNVIQDTSFAGIVFKQLDGGYGWGVRASRTDSKFTPHTNVVVRGNYISQTNTKYGCNSIYVTGSQHVLIERNVCKDSGTSAIESYNTDDVRIQYNETFGTVKKAGGADSNGIDTDRATTGAVVQYNYVHNNGDGILLCQFAFGDSVVRYNLILNNSLRALNLHSDSASTNQTYNNLIFIQGLGSADLIDSSGGATYLASPYKLSNNIFQTSRSASVVATGTGVTYSNNLFSGVTAVGSAAQTGDPMFVDSTARPNGTQAGPALSALSGFQLKAGSVARNHGVAITANGGVDFWGNALYMGAPDIGPFEQP